MSKTGIHINVRNEVLDFLVKISQTSENLEHRRQAYLLAGMLRPQRIRRPKVPNRSGVVSLVG